MKKTKPEGCRSRPDSSLRKGRFAQNDNDKPKPQIRAEPGAAPRFLRISNLRRYDSVTDVIYYLFLLAAVWILCKPVITRSVPAIGILLLSEATVLAVSFVRFQRYPATHSYMAKFYGLCLMAALIALLVFNASRWALIGLSVVAAITNAEIIAIHFLVNSPPVDVRSVFAARKLRSSA